MVKSDVKPPKTKQKSSSVTRLSLNNAHACYSTSIIDVRESNFNIWRGPIPTSWTRRHLVTWSFPVPFLLTSGWHDFVDWVEEKDVESFWTFDAFVASLLHLRCVFFQTVTMVLTCKVSDTISIMSMLFMYLCSQITILFLLLEYLNFC